MVSHALEIVLRTKTKSGIEIIFRIDHLVNVYWSLCESIDGNLLTATLAKDRLKGATTIHLATDLGDHRRLINKQSRAPRFINFPKKIDDWLLAVAGIMANDVDARLLWDSRVDVELVEQVFTQCLLDNILTLEIDEYPWLGLKIRAFGKKP